MTKLNLDKQESDFLDRIITDWEKQGLVGDEQAVKLRDSYEVKGFDWMRLAKYSFWIALICGATSFTFLIVNDTIVNWLKQLYYTPDILISILSAVMAAFLFLWGRRREKRFPERVFSNEAVVFTGILFTACCIAYLGKAFDNGSGHYSILFLVSVFVYGFLAWRLDSRLIWLFALSFIWQLVRYRNGLSNPMEPLFFRNELSAALRGIRLPVGCCLPFAAKS